MRRERMNERGIRELGTVVDKDRVGVHATTVGDGWASICDLRRIAT
jgi:hypothetical protein